MVLSRLFRRREPEPNWSIVAVQAQQGFMAALDAKREVAAAARKDPNRVFKDLMDAGMPEVYVLAFLDGVEKRNDVEKQFIDYLVRNNYVIEKKKQ